MSHPLPPPAAVGRRRVVITGIGLLTAFGVGKERLWEALLTGRSAVRPAAGFSSEGLPVDHFAELPEVDYGDFFEPRRAALWSRCSKAAVAAARLAVDDAGVAAVDSPRTGVFLGTGYGCTYEMEQTVADWRRGGWTKVKPMTVPRGMPNAPASLVALELGLRGPNATVSTACASGATALALAALTLRAGAADVCLAGGADVYLNASTAASWCALRVLSTRNAPDACRPFSADRDGLVLGEGAALLVLEDRQRAEQRGARIYAELAGAGTSNDATNVVAPDAAGEAAAIRAALTDAGREADEVDYVNAHGTGTAANDVTETRALEAALGGRARQVPVSSIKGHLGHAMGAGGAIEAAVTALAIAGSTLPPTLNLARPDPACSLAHVARAPLRTPVRLALSNSFGFGGQNAVLALARAG
jgi:nodulation protein E